MSVRQQTKSIISAGIIIKVLTGIGELFKNIVFIEQIRFTSPPEGSVFYYLFI